MTRLKLPIAAGLLIAASAASSAQSPQTAPLDITINGIENGDGAIVIAAFEDADAFEAMDVQNAVALIYLPATSSSISVTLHSLPAGDYAVAALHDENMDGDLNMDGDVPTEGYSFTAMGPSGLPPKFEDAAITAGEEARSVLRLKYW